MKVLVLNGPNLSRLGQREPEIYGTNTLQDVEQLLTEHGKSAGCTIRFLQSNHEGQLIDWIEAEGQQADAIIINPGALAHTSFALADALRGSGKPVIEVHISNVHRREAFRHQLITGGAAIGVITGLGIEGYALALDYLAKG
ncbi:MAG: type II 3-dehydroquinate dehydratase [Candidatus Dormibacteraeota bacterium]|nr:type II 3-dehydroquinate dehydratase [Candidatus Dormibacteraeota bacterium]